MTLNENPNKLISKSIFDDLKNYLSKDGDISYILSPFIKKQIFKKLIEDIKDKDLIVVTSWRQDYLLTKVTDLSLYNLFNDKENWSLYINDDLHLKFYSNDLKGAYIGSPNITKKGLQKNGNIEALNFIENLEIDDRIFIQKIVSDSILVTNDLYNQYKRWLETQDEITIPNKKSMNLKKNEDYYKFSLYNIPLTKSPTHFYDLLNKKKSNLSSSELKALEHDLAIFDIKYEEDMKDLFKRLRKEFFEKEYIKKIELLIEKNSNSLQFGNLKEWLQNKCIECPVPKRKELNEPTRTIFKWFVELGEGEYQIIRPKHSQILKKSEEPNS